MSNKSLENYRGTYEYTKLLEKHSLNEVGVWEIKGEDPNCDFGGSHSQPYLATVSGKLSDVIERAVELPKFWTWGAGGSIRKVNIVSVESLGKKADLNIEKRKLEERIKEIERELEN